jgi:hypothetical protein
MHAGSLRCTRCGKHRGWVSASALEAMRDAITKNFGRPVELPVLRTPPKPTGDDNMEKQFDNSNRGSIWKNTKKETDKHPDFTGNLNVDGKEFWVSAWRRKEDAPAKAPALTFSIKAKEETAKKADPISTGRARSDDAMSDEIPFNMEWRG